MKKKKPAFKHNVIAICYDFDGTLSRRSMQEDTIFKEYGIHAKQFWAEVNHRAKTEGYDKILAYLNKLIYNPEFQKKPLTEARLRAMANKIEYFPGVESFFSRINSFVKMEAKRLGADIKLEHYIISSGMRAILKGTSVWKHFKEIYACTYEYNKDQSPKCVKLAINDTNKTQFLFRINKGCLRLDQDINQHTPEENRRIPFQNMIYIGDGASDVPCMTVLIKNGGYALAVYPPKEKNPKETIKLLDAKRVHFVAAADYRPKTKLTQNLETILRSLIQRIVLNRAVYEAK